MGYTTDYLRHVLVELVQDQGTVFINERSLAWEIKDQEFGLSSGYDKHSTDRATGRIELKEECLHLAGRHSVVQGCAHENSQPMPRSNLSGPSSATGWALGRDTG